MNFNLEISNENKSDIYCHLRLNEKRVAEVCIEHREGILRTNMCSSFLGKETFALFGFGTYPEYQRKGYATIFLLKLFEYFKNLNADYLVLIVDKANKPALALYEKSGFKSYIDNEYAKYLYYDLKHNGENN